MSVNNYWNLGSHAREAARWIWMEEELLKMLLTQWQGLVFWDVVTCWLVNTFRGLWPSTVPKRIMMAINQ